ncbi:MAG TPA: hypothetical protein VFJ16_18050 [Longimicrobium sp.]|nr:hypothetical protein [Longimicrobium sp.]
MKKLRLDIDQIEVSGFDSMPVDTVGQGSVNGAEFQTRPTTCPQNTCPILCD